jgi:hypothetical protein
MDLAPSAVTAWLAATMLLAQASLGMFKANRRVLREWHIVLGVILLPVTFAHAWLAMKMVPMKFASAVGLRLATAALLLLGVQLLLGTALVRPSGSSRSVRKVHLAVGLGVVSLAGMHVLLTR